MNAPPIPDWIKSNVEAMHAATALRKMRFPPNQPSERITIDLKKIPLCYRLTAAAWAAGIDLKTAMSRATLYRHALALRVYGIEINPTRWDSRHAHADHA